MPNYVILTNYSDDVIKDMMEMDSDEFLEQTKATIKEHGGEIKDYYLTMGQYDVVGVAEFPDDEAVAEAMLTLIGNQNVETETLRAFSEEQTREIVGNLGE